MANWIARLLALFVAGFGVFFGMTTADMIGEVIKHQGTDRIMAFGVCWIQFMAFCFCVALALYLATYRERERTND